MRDRKSKNIEEQIPTICLRRSPRLLRKENQIGAQSPKTPTPTETRRGRPDSFSTPITKFKKTGHGVLGNGGEKETKSNSEKSRNGCRRSARTERRANFSSPDLEKQHVKEKRQTKSSVGGCRFVKASEKSGEGSSRRSGRRDRGVNVGKRDEVLEYVKEKRQTRSSVGGCRFVKVSEKSGEGSRRSGRGDRRVNVGKRDEVLESVIEKRVTRSSLGRNKVVIYEISDSESEEDSGEVILSKERKSKVGVDYAKKNECKFEKMVTRSSSKTDMKKANVKKVNVSDTSQRKGVISDEIEPKGNDDVSKTDTSRKDAKYIGIMMRNGEQNFTRKAQIGEKRKRDGVEEEGKTAQGWSNDQELALQRAYFTAKPTPQFWKKVARMVPGKSATECFERIHSDHQTPPQSRPRSRAKPKESSPLSFSASKLLSPVQMKSKRLGTRRRTLLAQKTVRQILQKQQKEDEDYNADLFAVLEPSVNPSPVIFTKSTSFVSPEPNKASPFLTTCRQMSSSSQRKHLSRINSSQKLAFASPPVLKQIKNKALHEKYIDQLHCREAKRKAAALRNSRNLKNQIDEHVNDLKQNFVKAAKDALVSGAQDAISKLRSLQSRTDEDDDDDDDDEDEDEDEDEDDL